MYDEKGTQMHPSIKTEQIYQDTINRQGNHTVVLDDSEHLLKLNLLLESGVYETLPK
jgi:hypothetical protein